MFIMMTEDAIFAAKRLDLAGRIGAGVLQHQQHEVSAFAEIILKMMRTAL